MKSALTGSLVGLVALLSSTGVVFAQAPTFGPICDGVTVTCVPTPSPTTAQQQLNPTETPTPTLTPTPSPSPTPTRTPTPKLLPKAGDTGSSMLLLSMGTVFLAGGLMTKFAFSKSKSR